jgi:hypothetical protein
MSSIIQGEAMTEKPKRKIIPCPQCDCDEGMTWQIGFPPNIFQCSVCLIYLDTDEGSITELSTLGAWSALHYSVMKLWRVILSEFGIR